jgi:hypothetical protein
MMDENCEAIYPLTVPDHGTDEQLKDAFVAAFREPCFHVNVPYLNGDVVCVMCIQASDDYEAERRLHIIKLLDNGRVFVAVACWALVAFGWFDPTQIILIGSACVLTICLMNLMLQRHKLSVTPVKPITAVCTGPTVNSTGQSASDATST